MRVTIVTTWFPTHRSPGLGVFVARHAASMAAAGHDIRVVHPVSYTHLTLPTIYSV